MTTAAPGTGFAPVELQLRDGRCITLRSVCPQDKEAVQAVVKGLSEGARYTRFMSALKELSPQMLERAVNPDAARELQLVAVHGEGALETIVGGARYVGGAGSRDCEFAVTIVDAWQGLGLARRLLQALMRAARDHGFERMEGYILASNKPMLGLARRLGFTEGPSSDGPGVRMVRCDLSATA